MAGHEGPGVWGPWRLATDGRKVVGILTKKKKLWAFALLPIGPSSGRKKQQSKTFLDMAPQRPLAPFAMPAHGPQPHAGSSSSASSDASSSAAGSSSPSHIPTVVASSSAAAAAAAAALPLQQQQQQILHHYQHQLHQHQLQQQQRLLSLHLSTSSPPPAPLALPPPPTSADLKPPTADPAPPDRHFRDDCWSEGATLTLIQAWGDRYLELNRGNLKQKHWKDVAESVNGRAHGSKAPKTDVQCKNRLDTLKKKYKIEKSKMVTGGAPSKWAFFERLDELIGPSKKPKAPAGKVRPIGVEGQGLPSAASKRPLEEDEKPPLLFSPPPLLIAPPPPINNHAGGSSADTASKSKGGPDMSQSWPPNSMPDDGNRHKRKRVGHRFEEGNSFKELARAILKFGEVYERVETAKQQQMVELEKQRMEFTKDLELQRLQLFMQTQVELAKMKYGSSSKHSNTEHYL